MSVEAKKSAAPTGLFASFSFLQYTILWLANRAGDGWLPIAQRELVYYALQVLVILGFLACAVAERLLRGSRIRKRFTVCVLAVCCAGTAVMLFAGKGSAAYVAVTFAVVLCLGWIGCRVYHRMSLETAAGARTACSMGLGGAAAIALQYLFQIRWNVRPLLAVLALVAFALLALLLTEDRTASPAASQRMPIPPRRLVVTVLTAAGLLLFVSFYNETIHHLQIRSGYTTYNVYSWPRLMMLPGYLLFGAIGDRRGGKLVPVSALCLSLSALLNSVLTNAYWLNMCLFYVALSGAISYYNLCFWRLAPGTKHPALWAYMGRAMDSGMVLVSGLLQTSLLPAAAVQAGSVAVLAGIIVLMAAGGDFNLSSSASADLTVEPPETDGRTPEQALTQLQERFALTAREAEVLRELVRTEDKQTVISERLGIKVKTLQEYVTRIYRKTGATTRSGLTELYHESRSGR